MGFEIWQKDTQEKREFATGREVYYPVFHVAPLLILAQPMTGGLPTEARMSRSRPEPPDH